MIKYKNILADADNTLFDFDKAEEFALKNTLSHFGLPYSYTLLMQYRKTNIDLWKKVELGEYTKKELFSNRFALLKEIEGFDYENNLEAINKAYTQNLSQCYFTIDGAEQLLKSLKSVGCNIYMVTNGLKIVQENRFSKSRLLQYFDKVYISEVIGYQKPMKEFFDYVFSDALISDKKSCIILGDSLTSDMQGGRNAGIATCRLNRNNEPKSNLCDFEINKLDDFLSIVMQNERTV